jgi:hypothetical protein
MTTSCLHKHILYFRSKLTKLALKFTNGFKLGKRPCKCEDAKIVILADFIDILCNYKGFDNNPTLLFSIKINSLSGEMYDLDFTLSTGFTINLTVDTSTHPTIDSALLQFKIMLEGLGFTTLLVNNILYVYTNDSTYTNATVVSNVDKMIVSNLSNSLEEYLDKINCISYKELCNLLTSMKQSYKEC